MGRIEEIEARLQAATPGPWQHYAYRPNNGYRMWAIGALRHGRDSTLADMRHYDEAEVDAELIAHALDDIHYLVDRVRELEAERDRLLKQREALKAAVLNMNERFEDMVENVEMLVETICEKKPSQRIRDLEAERDRLVSSLKEIANSIHPCPNCTSEQIGFPCPYRCDHGWIYDGPPARMAALARAALQKFEIMAEKGPDSP